MDSRRNLIKWYLAAVMAVSLLPAELIFPALIVIFGLFLGLFLVLLFNNKTEDCIFLLNIFIMAFLLRIIAGLFLYNFVFLSNGTGLLGDAWPYSDNGRSILRLWHEGVKDFNEIEMMLIPINNAGNLGAYDVWNAMIFSFTGYSPVSVTFINCLAGSLTILVIYAITEQVYNREAARFAAILTAFWPSLFLWSIQNLKEAISTLLISIMVLSCVRFKRQFKFSFIILFAISMLALKEFRGFVFLAFLAALLFSFFWPIWKYKKIEAFVLLALLIAAAFLFIPDIKIWAANVANEKNINSSILSFVHERRSFKAEGGSAFLSNFDLTNPFAFLLYVPIGLFVAWFSPFPWQIGSMLQIITFPETLCYYSLLFYLVTGIKYVVRHKLGEAGIVISVIFIMQMVLAVSEGNIGTLFRHRSMVYPLMFVLGSIGFIEKKRQHDNAR